jgi:hypothetical protein
MLSKALEMGVSIGTPLLGKMQGCSFLRAFERREKIYLGEFLREI